ncbi:gag-pol polyprotein [Tanacetum coccineum]
MFKPERVKVDAYIRGLTENIKGEVTSSILANLNEAVRMAHTLMEQNSSLPVCERCFTHHDGPCTIKCHKCGKVGHKARYYKEKSVATGANAQPIPTCYDCGEQGHTRNRCPKKLKQLIVLKQLQRRYMENYKNVSQDIRDQLNAKAEAVQIIFFLHRGSMISTPQLMLVANACVMWKAIEVEKQGGLLCWGLFLGARENVGTLVVQKSGIQCYNCKEYGHVSRECQKPKRVKDAAYHKEKMLLCKQEEAGVQLNAEQADWKDDTDDESEDQELEAHYMYMAQIQEVTPDPVDNSGPIFDDEPMHKVQNNNDNYNVFAMENEHPEQPESSNDIYLAEQGDTNITIDSLDICYDRVQDDQDDTDDLDQERDLLASLIQKLKCEIDDSKNRNKILESSNKALVDKLKGEIKDFKTKNKSLESSNNHFKEANNEVEIFLLCFAKPEFLKKAQRANPRLYDIGCYNDNLALMLSPESDETIRLDKECRSKLSDLIRPFDYGPVN